MLTFYHTVKIEDTDDLENDKKTSCLVILVIIITSASAIYSILSLVIFLILM